MDSIRVTEQHLADLAARAFDRGYTTYSDFLNMEEISLLKGMDLPVSYTLYGGYEGAERCVAAFGGGEQFPIDCLAIKPLQQKFADALSHRDFLGALMNLGIERNTLGDIVIKDNIGYLFCLKSISSYILQSLTRVRHTTVDCTVIEEIPDVITELPDETQINVSSLRADAVIASAYHLSRNETAQLFLQGKIFINSRACQKSAVQVKEKDMISVRGYGRFLFEGAVRETKKGRTVIRVRIYQ